MNFQNAIDSGSQDLTGTKLPPSGTVSGATGSTCTESGVYRATHKAQYLEVIARRRNLPPFLAGRARPKQPGT